MSSKQVKNQTTLLSFFSFSRDGRQQERPLSERIAVIVVCSKQKFDHKAPASELYQGDMFKKSKLIAIKLQADFYILSAKYGLITGSKIIEPYETVIQTKKDKDRLRLNLDGKILENLALYGKVIIIMGQKYRDVLEPFFKNNYYILRTSTGLGEYKTLLNNLTKFSPRRILQALEEYKGIFVKIEEVKKET